MKRIWAGIALPVLLFAVGAAAETPNPVYIDANGGSGNGVRFNLGEACVVVTAQHLVKGGSYPKVLAPGDKAASPATVSISDPIIDIGLMTQKVDNPQKCGSMPTPDLISARIAGAVQRELRWVRPDGSVKHYAINLVEEADGGKLILQFVPNASLAGSEKALITGMSGSVIVFDGVPVAISQSASSDMTFFQAQRLDWVVQKYPQYFNYALPAGKGPKTFAPFAEEQLPLAYRRAIQASNAVKKRAEMERTDATDVMNKSINALQVAKAGSAAGYKDFDGYDSKDETRTNNIHYSGQIIAKNGINTSAGYGVKEIISGSSIHDKIYCRWVDGAGCQGNFVVYYDRREGQRWKYWYGQGSGDTKGYGYVSYWDGDTYSELWVNNNGDSALYAVYSNGNILQCVTLNGNCQGPGVVWDSKGKLVSFGLYEKGEMVKNETGASPGG